MKKIFLSLLIITFSVSLFFCKSKKENDSELNSNLKSKNKNDVINNETILLNDVNAQLNKINNKLKANGIGNFEKSWLLLTRNQDNDEFYILQTCDYGTPEIKLLYDESNFCYILQEIWAQDSKDNLIIDFNETANTYEFTINDYFENDLQKSIDANSRKLSFDKISNDIKIVKLWYNNKHNFFVAGLNKNQYGTIKEDCY